MSKKIRVGVLNLIILFIASGMVNYLVSGFDYSERILQSGESTYLTSIEDDGLTDPAWPMFKHDIRHTGRSSFGPSLAENLPVIKWKFLMDGKIISSPSIDKNGTIYIGSNGDDCMFAIYPNGTEKCRAYIGNAHSSPAISNDNTIYIGANNGNLYAIYQNGTIKWSINCGSGWTFSSPVIDYNETIYAASVDSCRLCAIDPNGTVIWYFYTDSYIYCSPALDQEGNIFIGSNDGYMYAIYPNGTLKWRYYAGGQKGIGAAPTIADDGTIYFGSTSGYLYALNPNGTERWNVHTGWIGGSSPSISDSGMIYVGDQDYNRIYCIDRNGSIQWSYQTGDEILTSPAIDKNGIIYCASLDNYLYALNPDGTLRWKFKAGDEGIESSPTIGEDGTIYIAGQFKPSGGQNSHTYLYALNIIENNPPAIPMITGTAHGKVRTTYDYIIVSSDSDDDNISYFIDWGDDSTTDWIGPYVSGDQVVQSHQWTKRGTYTIQVKARDEHGMESDWGTLTVIMPYEPPQHPFIHWLLERFPNAFPLLRYLIGFV